MAYIGQSLTEGTRRVYTYVATASQTTFNAVYGVGAVDVYQNGILLAPADYTASDGATVVLGVGAAFQDEITIVCHNTFSVADTVSASQGGTFNQPVTIDGNGATVLTVDRAASDGTIIDVQKNGTTVGSIGTDSGYLYVGSDGTGSRVIFDDVANNIRPWAGATTDLGRSTTLFKDLYLSGGVYLGGTGAANYLDDYEEGTWTPRLRGGTTEPAGLITGTGRYVKVGDLVTAYFSFENQDTTGYVGDTSVDQFPFTNAAQRTVGSAGAFNAVTWTGTLILEIPSSNTKCGFMAVVSGGAWNAAQHSAGTVRYLWGNFSYRIS